MSELTTLAAAVECVQAARHCDEKDAYAYIADERLPDGFTVTADVRDTADAEWERLLMADADAVNIGVCESPVGGSISYPFTVPACDDPMAVLAYLAERYQFGVVRHGANRAYRTELVERSPYYDDALARQQKSVLPDDQWKATQREFQFTYGWNRGWSTERSLKAVSTPLADGEALAVLCGSPIADNDRIVVGVIDADIHNSDEADATASRKNADPDAILAELEQAGVEWLMVTETPADGLHVYIPVTPMRSAHSTELAIEFQCQTATGLASQCYEAPTRRPKYRGKGYRIRAVNWALLDSLTVEIAERNAAVLRGVLDDLAVTDNDNRAKVSGTVHSTDDIAYPDGLPTWLLEELAEPTDDRSVRFYALTGACVRARVTYATAYAVLHKWDTDNGGKYASRGDDKFADQFRTCWDDLFEDNQRAGGFDADRAEAEGRIPDDDEPDWVPPSPDAPEWMDDLPVTDEPAADRKGSDANLTDKVAALITAEFDFVVDKHVSSAAPTFYGIVRGTARRYIAVDPRSEDFADLVRPLIRRKLGKAVASTTVTEAVRYVYSDLKEGYTSARKVTMALRSEVIRDGGRIREVVIDVADPSSRTVIVVDARGYRVQDDYPGVVFTAASGVRPLTLPTSHPDYSVLSQTLRFGEDSAEWHLVRGWLATFFIANIERPMLYFSGEAGSGKTTRAIAAAQCVNPLAQRNGSLSLGGGLGKGSDDDVKALNNYCLTYDNLSKVSVEQSDFIATAVTGIVKETRRLYSNGDSFEIVYKRTGVLTGISVPNFKPDAMERLILLYLHPFADGAREPGTVIWRRYNDAVGDILAAVLTDLSTIIARQDLKADWLPRMGDYFENLLRLDSKVADAYRAAVENSVEEQAENDPFVQTTLRAVKAEGGTIKGQTWQDIYNDWLPHVEDVNRRFFPYSGRTLAAKVRESASLLRKVGVYYGEGVKQHGGVRTYWMSVLETPPE